MQRRFNSCLLRFWDRADGTVRIEIEHIQEGARVVVDSTAVALRWIDAHATTDRTSAAIEHAADLMGNGPAEDSELGWSESDPTNQEKPSP
jgi:hypothetical protein